MNRQVKKTIKKIMKILNISSFVGSTVLSILNFTQGIVFFSNIILYSAVGLCCLLTFLIYTIKDINLEEIKNAIENLDVSDFTVEELLELEMIKSKISAKMTTRGTATENNEPLEIV